MAVTKSDRQPLVSLTPEEILRVMRVAKQHGPRELAMFVLAFKHGLRSSEIANLRLDDIDMRNGSIKISRLKGSLSTTQDITDHRGEPLLSEIKALRSWLASRKDDGSEFLFNSGKGGRISRIQVFRLFQGIAAEAGLDPVKCHPHVCKHSLATALVAANVNLAVIKQQLGHKSISSTMKYISVSDQDASKATREALMKLF